ncbi:hypothetical protein VFPPC_16593 [Pochonia chlamydosporia 170]|uniref:Uncharacterized protein n=1 Tax=Pochonia chlamydosporia 170 TaxID=1380566 RepID=A0A179FAA9_METCM|nr:hypothetical protein VFPPC_16593 [Pochonia chlamydosporia 170]OAQ62013.1 hypothetical protein VFPPC_16593 [Pochonia chlamydosporia 170]
MLATRSTVRLVSGHILQCNRYEPTICLAKMGIFRPLSHIFRQTATYPGMRTHHRQVWRFSPQTHTAELPWVLVIHVGHDGNLQTSQLCLLCPFQSIVSPTRRRMPDSASDYWRGVDIFGPQPSLFGGPCSSITVTFVSRQSDSHAPCTS